MIAVIQCAATKRADAGHLLSPDGIPITFVANPAAAPANPAVHYARPDDGSGNGMTWREELVQYNSSDSDNPLHLSAAYMLYGNNAYKRLVAHLGTQKVYILSAGWGLVRADFWTPYYDITFSANAEPYKRRRKTDSYQDFCMLPSVADENLVFFGGREYLGLFSLLTAEYRGTKTVFYNSADQPELVGCKARKFETTARTNWHYQCVNAFLDGRIDIR